MMINQSTILKMNKNIKSVIMIFWWTLSLFYFIDFLFSVNNLNLSYYLKEFTNFKDMKMAAISAIYNKTVSLKL